MIEFDLTLNSQITCMLMPFSNLDLILVPAEEYERQEMQTVDSAKLAQAKFSFNQGFEFSVLLLEITLLLSKWRGTR